MAQAGLFVTTVRVAGRLRSDREIAWSGAPTMLTVNVPASNACRTAEADTCLLGSVVSHCPMQLHACSMNLPPHTPSQGFNLAGRTDMLGTDSLPGMCLPDLQKPG